MRREIYLIDRSSCHLPNNFIFMWYITYNSEEQKEIIGVLQLVTPTIKFAHHSVLQAAFSS